MPAGFGAVAGTDTCPFAAIANPEKKMFGIQFHPEVTHSPAGRALMGNFVVTVCGAAQDWNMADLADTFVREVPWPFFGGGG